MINKIHAIQSKFVDLRTRCFMESADGIYTCDSQESTESKEKKQKGNFLPAAVHQIFKKKRRYLLTASTLRGETSKRSAVRFASET